jgi:flotillin
MSRGMDIYEVGNRNDSINTGGCLCLRTCGASEAIVKAGCGLKGDVKVVDGGMVCVWPCCQITQMLDLSLMTLSVESPNMDTSGMDGDICVYTKDGVPVRVNSVAQVRIGPPPEIGANAQRGTEKMLYLKSAASIFGGLGRRDCKSVITQTLEGHQRSMIGNMYAKELLMDRSKFAEEVNRSATVDLIGMGVWVTSFVIQEIKDDNDYINSLGKAEVAKKKEQARIATAEMEKDANIKEAEQERNAQVKQFENRVTEEHARMKYDLREADNLKQTNQRKAVADMAQARKEMEVSKQVVEREQNVKIKETEMQIIVAEKEVDRMREQLGAEMIKPTEAQCFAIGKDAEAKAKQIELRAIATATEVKQHGEAVARAEKVKGEAEAEAMLRKADAWSKYSRATFLDKIIAQLPEITESVASAVGSTDSITLVSNNSNGTSGANKLAKEVTDALATMPAAVEVRSNIPTAIRAAVSVH